MTKMNFKPPVRMTVRIQRVGLNLKRGIKGRPRAHTAKILQLQREEAVEVKNK